MELLILSAFAIASLYGLVRFLYEKLQQTLPKDLDEVFQAMDKFSSRDIVRLRLLHKLVVFVNNPQLVHKVLASDVCLEKPQLIYKLLNINDGLLASQCKLSHGARSMNYSR
jgi:hypothetical protein